MVSLAHDARDDRGQLMLVGAVTLAALLIGLVIVFNSALFTETVDQESAIQSSNNALQFMTQTERNVRSLTIRVNHARTYSDPAALNSSIRSNVTEYNVVLKEAYVDATATYVNVSYTPDGSLNGRRVVQSGDLSMTGPGGASTWSPLSSRTWVGWTVLNLNASEVPLFGEFSVRMTNASGEFYEASFQRNDTGYVVVTTNSSAFPATNGTVACAPVNGRLLVDVLSGEVYERDCVPQTTNAQFNGTDAVLDGPLDVEFVNGGDAVGKYEIVVKEESAVSGLPSCPSGSSPCKTPAAWAVNTTLVYRSSQVQVRKNVTVEVYNGTE